MDPDACYFGMYDAMRQEHFEDAKMHALALKEWIDRDGFYPQHYSKVEVDAYLASVLRRTACIAL